jgi:hypothetical protein
VFVSGLAYSFQSRPKTAVVTDRLVRGREAHFFDTLDSPKLGALLDPGWFSNFVTVFRSCGFSAVHRT